jgi:hypothetical protein
MSAHQRSRRGLLGGVALLLAVLAPQGAPAAGFDEFGIKSVGAEESTAAAGLHPDFVTKIFFNKAIVNGKTAPAGRLQRLSVDLPPGLVGNPMLVPRCSTALFNAFGDCPIASQVGVVETEIFGFGEGPFLAPLYVLEPPHKDEMVARLGFFAFYVPVFINVSLRTAGDYGVTATVINPSATAGIASATTTLWGNPSDPSHNALRGLTIEEGHTCYSACEAEGGERKTPLGPIAFLSNPSACQANEVGFKAASYQLPDQVFTARAPMGSTTACHGLPFEPSFEAQPTSHRAGAPTGLQTKLVIPQHAGAEEAATATLREARVSLPQGMSINPSAANGLQACSAGQVGYHQEVDAACPDASKLGTVKVVSPALAEPIQGALYQRNQEPGHPFGLWLVADELGMHVKLPGEIIPVKSTGRLTAVFTDLPQVPVEEIDFDVWGGGRAPLQNPDSCGTYTTDYSFAPHSEDPVASGQSQIKIDEGCGQGFDPTLDAGVANPVAGKFSPLIIDLTRGDGQQNLRGFTLTLPDGELAKLKGVPLCPEGAAGTGSCPPGSAIGHVVAAAGAGADPLWLPQSGKAQPTVYLAGPYEGSPLSVVTVVPAQAGPFDLGSVVVRSGLGLDPDTNRAVVKADPLPQFFEGVGLTYRHLQVVLDRPKFSLNPTDCREMQVDSTFTSTQGAVAHPASRFQVRGCKRLKFRPKLALKLRGGTKRADYPALTATLKPRRGDANLGRVSVALPHSEFLAQEHIGTICTRVRFAADSCPKGSVYGEAKAWTPLLDKPLEGPVYLRSSDHPLPDLVMDLQRQLEVVVSGRIDSKHGGIRTTFEAVPDAPITKVVLRMKGGKKGLLTNSQDICVGDHRATVEMRAQNGRAQSSRPLLQGRCGKRHRE